MSKAYNPDEIELKWQKRWEDAHCFEAEASHEKPKFYGLIEFPYPSGAGLHVGHPRSNTAMDIIARKRRMEGYNVLFPIGWDAFGLPTENYAIKNHVHPAGVTEKNINHFREQLKRIGFSFDWTREVNTTDPNYFKWMVWRTRRRCRSTGARAASAVLPTRKSSPASANAAARRSSAA